MWRSLVATLIGCVLFAAGASAWSQGYPSKPIRFLTGGPGSNGDFASRVLGYAISGAVGQQVVVENRASGVILGDTVAKAPPDGYTLLITGSSFWLAPFLQENLPWDPVRDFAPISLVATSPNLIVVHPSLPTRSVRDLVKLAKARPGELNYASGATGSAPHLAAELFKKMAGVSITRINYRGAGQALNDLIAGHVQVMFPNGGSAAGHVKSGRLRALAVTSPKPSALFPGLPTVAASGVPGYEAELLNGVFAPAKTPGAIISRLNQELVRALSRSDVKEKFLNAGVETVGSSAEQLAAAIKSEMTVWGKVIQEAGIRAD